ncbi:MAG: DUF222 domain-containing protein [Ilumatobacteraceae bacterium]|nr:DUF222 domain-containing protein [Ilumatobacteraceae bacterium]
MEPEQYAELHPQMIPGRLSVSDAAHCGALLAQLNRLRSWVESCSLAVTARLNALAIETPGIFPEQIVADATRVSLNQAIQPFKRTEAVELLPEFGAALSAGAVNVDHVDVLARSIASLDKPTRQRLAERDGFLTEIATRTTSGEFARTLRSEIRRAQRDDGIATLQRQRRATRLRTWIDRETGMWCLRGEFDPETGAILETRINTALEALFHNTTPDTCPADLLDKQHHLRALALFSVTAGNKTGRAGSIDMSILIDAKTLLDGVHDHSVIDCGLGIELPVETLRRMACYADITPIIVGADGVHLDLQQTTRLANREQRRALRAMYKGCAVPGCCVAWDYIVIHHLKYFRNGGPTDIANLLPLCHKHHHLAHEGGWQYTLDPARNLTITKPDGTRMTTGPPRALAA